MMRNEASTDSYFSFLITHSQVKLDVDPPQLTFFLLIHNMGPVGGTNLSQVSIRDSISGIVPIKTEGRVVERGYQTFAIDSLSGMYGNHNVLQDFLLKHVCCLVNVFIFCIFYLLNCKIKLHCIVFTLQLDLRLLSIILLK